MTPDISLILPAYNEVRIIPVTIGEAVRYFESRGLRYQIIVAADGTDGTREIVREMAIANPALVATGADGRRGKGRGIREGGAIATPEIVPKVAIATRALVGTGAEARRGKGLGIREAVAIAPGAIIGYADADNKVPIDDFDKFRPVLAAGADMAIGSRRGAAVIERAQPLYRRVGSVGFRWFMRTVVGLAGIQDTQCGFKFFQHAVAKELFLRQKIDGYMFDVEILAIARRLGYRIEQLPIRWRDDADSRFNLISALRDVHEIFRIGREHRFGGRFQ